MKKKINVGLIGASGRMGKAIIDCSKKKNSEFDICWKGSTRDKTLESLTTCGCDVIIDFSEPASTLRWTKEFVGKKMPKALICTTGFTPSQNKKLITQLKGKTYALAPNTSLGVFALNKVLKELSETLDKRYSFHLHENHHTKKKDAPSGTAKHLAKTIDEHRPPGRKKTKVTSSRVGDDPGTHTVEIFGPSEILSFTHQAEDRRLFAEGALFLAGKLYRSRKKGALKGVSDLIK